MYVHTYLPSQVTTPASLNIRRYIINMRSFAVGFFLAATTAAKNVVPSLWDSQCFYPQGDLDFELDSYLGRWYQVAGTIAPFTADCRCIFTQYELNVTRDSGLARSISP